MEALSFLNGNCKKNIIAEVFIKGCTKFGSKLSINRVVFVVAAEVFPVKVNTVKIVLCNKVYDVLNYNLTVGCSICSVGNELAALV